MILTIPNGTAIRRVRGHRVLALARLRVGAAHGRVVRAALDAHQRDHAAERRKAEQLQRMLNSEHERAQSAAATRDEQHQLEVNAMKDEFAKLLEQRDKRIAKLAKQQDNNTENTHEREGTYKIF